MEITHNKVGPPVEGADFFGREKELSDTWEDISEGNNLLICAPRRIGKSSLVKKLITIAIENDWKGSYMDVQDLSSELEFYKMFVSSIKRDTTSWMSKSKEIILGGLSELISKIELTAANDAGSITLKWNGKEMNEIKEQIVNLLHSAGDLLIAIDELPFFLARLEKSENGTQRVADFLSMLRALRHKDLTNVRWVFCGSIGLDHFTSRLNLTGTLNDLLSYPLSAFDEPTAIAFLKKLGDDHQLRVDDVIARMIIEKIGWPLPYFLQAHFKQLRRLKAEQLGTVITQLEIENAYDKILQDNQSLRTWEERLDDQFDELESRRCKLILTGLCKAKKGLQRKKLFDILYTTYGEDSTKCANGLGQLLGILENDGYIILAGTNYAFRSPLLRDYWYKIKVK
jgi:AAA+ ATPase superfamily predicted ATPase